MPRRDNLQKSSDSSAISTTKTEAIHDTSSRSVLSIEDSGIIKYLAVSYSILTLDCPFCWTPISLPELSWQPELWTEGPPPRTDQNVQRSHRMLLWWSSELRTFHDNKLLKAAMEYRTALDTWPKCKRCKAEGCTGLLAARQARKHCQRESCMKGCETWGTPGLTWNDLDHRSISEW